MERKPIPKRRVNKLLNVTSAILSERIVELLWNEIFIKRAESNRPFMPFNYRVIRLKKCNVRHATAVIVTIKPTQAREIVMSTFTM